MNDAKLEPKVQILTKDNNDAIIELRNREEQGILPPVLLKFEEK